MPADQDAGSPGGNLDTPVVEPDRTAAAGLCAACGRDLASLSPSRTGQRRKTCSDACRKAYQRGHRAPVPGVVAPEAIEALSRLDRRFISGFGRGDPDPGPGPDQLALVPPA